MATHLPIRSAGMMAASACRRKGWAGACGPSALLLAAILLLADPGRARAAPACPPAPVAEIGLRDVGGFLVLRAAIDGTPVSLLLDTGAETGLLTPDAAARLRLPPDPGRHSLLQGTGGVGAVSPNAVVPRLALGALTLLGASLPVGPLPATARVEPPVVGLLGADLLPGFDLELDFARGVLALHPASPECAGTAPWPGAEAIGLRRLGDRLAAPVAVDGTVLSALVDTGARSIVLSNAAAGRLGVTQAALAGDPGGLTGGIDMRETAYHWHRFASLRIGQDTTRNPVLTVTELRDETDMLLGSDWLARHRVWLSWRNAVMYVRRPDG